jgi:hypothetical protein
LLSPSRSSCLSFSSRDFPDFLVGTGSGTPPTHTNNHKHKHKRTNHPANQPITQSIYQSINQSICCVLCVCLSVCCVCAVCLCCAVLCVLCACAVCCLPAACLPAIRIAPLACLACRLSASRLSRLSRLSPVSPGAGTAVRLSRVWGGGRGVGGSFPVTCSDDQPRRSCWRRSLNSNIRSVQVLTYAYQSDTMRLSVARCYC